MTTPHKAMLIQARDALENLLNCDDACKCSGRRALAALTAAIDAPETEPVALRHSYNGYDWIYADNGSGSSWKCQQYPDGEFLYTHPPAVREPLTEAEIIKIAQDNLAAEPGRDGYILPISFARAIEAAVMSKL